MRFMRKFATTAVLSLASAVSAVAASIDFSTKTEGEHVSNGSKWGQGKQEFSFGITNKFAKGYLTVGVDNRLMEGRVGCNKVAPRISYAVGVKNLFAIDFGYQSYFYFRTNGCASHTNELHLSARAGGDFFVELGTTYCFEERDFNAWFTSSMMSDLLVFNSSASIAMRSSITVGYDRCDRPGAIGDFFSAVAPGNKPGYFYFGWNGDLCLKRSSTNYSYVGVRWAGNAASKWNWNNDVGNRRSLLWFAIGTEASF